MKITKRNGNVVDFDKNKIIVAINKAAKELFLLKYRTL